MRIVFFGSPQPAARVLSGLIAAGHDVALVVTREPKRRGRGSSLEETPVALVAQAKGIDVAYSAAEAAEVDADLGVVVAFGSLIKEPVLSAFPILNVHYSLLPRWRGAAPVERAILAGDKTTGVCIMEVVKELDAGDVYLSHEISIGFDTYASDLYDELTEVGTKLLLKTISGPLPKAIPQVGEPTYAYKLNRDEFRIDWANSAEEILRKIRCDRAWTVFRDQDVRILRAEPADLYSSDGHKSGEIVNEFVMTGNGALRLLKIQPAGKPATDFESWLRGARIQPGEAFV